MNYARITHSPRLARALAALADQQEHSTRELIAKADLCAVNSVVAELRANGFAIRCRCAVEDGQRRYYYRLTLGRARPESRHAGA